LEDELYREGQWGSERLKGLMEKIGFLRSFADLIARINPKINLYPGKYSYKN